MFGGYIKLGETIDLVVTVHRFSTGTEAAPTSGPVIIITKNGVDMVYAPTATLLATGEYLFSIELSNANLFEVGTRNTVRARATDADAVIGGAGITSWIVSENSPDDIASLLAVVAVLLDHDMGPRLEALESYVEDQVTGMLVELDDSVAAVQAKTDGLPSDPASESTAADAFSVINALLTAIAGYIDTEVAAIKAKTDGLPADPASASVLAALFAALPTAAQNRDALLNYSYRAGRTVRGVIRRLGSALETVIGLKGSTVIYYQPDGVTEEFRVVQNVANGSRSNPVVTPSEVP